MSFFSSFGSFFKRLGSILLSAFDAAGGNGLTDQIVQLALTFVKEAAVKFADNTERREWVVAQLVAKGIPESLARLGVELAVQLLKRELGTLPVNTTGIIWGS